MDAKEEGILLGKLEAFREEALGRLQMIEAKVDKLEKFKMRVTVTMVILLGGIECAFRIIEVIK